MFEAKWRLRLKVRFRLCSYFLDREFRCKLNQTKAPVLSVEMEDAESEMMMSTQALPVRGKLHFFRILGAPCLLVLHQHHDLPSSAWSADWNTLLVNVSSTTISWCAGPLQGSGPITVTR